MRYRRRHDGAARPLCRHLLLHRQADFFGRSNVLELDAHDLDAPLLSRAVERRTKLGIRRITRREGVIQVELADDVT